MAFSINTNVGSLQAYNALAKVTVETQRAQFHLATTKKINSVADDTSGYNVGKKLEAQTIAQKAQLNNVTSAKNYLSTAETALQQINDKLNQISSKYTDSEDPLKDKASVASDICTLAKEVDSILRNTKINNSNLLAKTNGSSLSNSPTFDVGGSTFAADFASSSILNTDAIKSALYGSSTDPGVAHYTGSDFSAYDNITIPNGTSTLKATFADGTSADLTVSLSGCTQIKDVYNAFFSAMASQRPPFEAGGGYLTGSGIGNIDIQYYYNSGDIDDHGPNIVSLETVSGYDVAGTLGITKHSSGTIKGGLINSDTDTVLSAASNISAIKDNVKSALGRIGNSLQTLDSRSEFLTSSIANNTSTISNIFDADMAQEQMTTTKGSIASQISTAILSQINAAPQQLMTLFR